MTATPPWVDVQRLLHIVGQSNARLLYPANHENQKARERERSLHILELLPFVCVFKLRSLLKFRWVRLGSRADRMRPDPEIGIRLGNTTDREDKY